MSRPQAGARSARSPRFRHTVGGGDVELVRDIVERAAVFSTAEVDIAVELLDERLAKGPDSGYHFVFAEQDGRTLGYTCYGPIPGTAQRYDLYWIVVDPSFQNEGAGRLLLVETERLVRSQGGQRLYAETSGLDRYAPARAFYERRGFRRVAVLADFYADGDDKIVYGKILSEA